jgi:hypothetical protein
VDDGAAPNAFFGYWTLVVCKPAIRRTARIGDWIVGTGSRHVAERDFSDQLVYAMHVTDKVSMADYDAFVKGHCPGKVPELRSRSWRRWLGDALYDFTSQPPRVRPGVHNGSQQETGFERRLRANLKPLLVFWGSRRAVA